MEIDMKKFHHDTETCYLREKLHIVWKGKERLFCMYTDIITGTRNKNLRLV